MQMNISYWEDRYKEQGRKTVGCCSFNEVEFEKRSFEMRRLLKEFLFRSLPSRFKRVLDFGCGIGRMELVLQLYSDEVYGVDVVEWAIEQAKRDCPLGHFLTYDGRTIPFNDGFFDGLLSWTVLQHIPDEDIKGVCKEIERVLSNESHLILYENISVWHENKTHIWFRSLDRYKVLFSGMDLISEQRVENADGNDEHHILMLFKKG